MRNGSHWTRGRGVSRRWVLGSGALGAGAAFAAACGGGSDDKKDSGAAQQQATATGPAPAGPISQATQETPVKGGTLRRGTYLNVLGIDPHIEVSVGLVQMAAVYTYLGGFNIVDQTWNPVFAQGVEQKSTQEFVFTLKKGVKFHNVPPVNGREVTAEDVKYSFERARDHPKSQGAAFFKQFVDKMEAVDPYTFRLTTKQPFAETLFELGEWKKAIVPREAVEKFTDLSQNAIGAGPFIMEEYVRGERLKLKKNPDYFDKNLPHLDALTWITILDQNTLLQAYKSDQIDINGTLLSKLDYDDLRRNDKLNNIKYPGLHYGWFGVNASVKPYNDKRVREALFLAIDRAQFIDKVGQGEGSPQAVLSNGLNFWALSQDEIKPYITPDLKKAKDLLTAAGYPNGFEMEIETSGGVQLYIDHAEVLVPQLAKIGVTAKLKLNDLSAFLADKLFVGKFNHAVVLTSNPYETPNRPLDFYHKNGVSELNWYHYDNPQVNALIDAQKVELDVNKRQKIVKDAQKAILEDAAPLTSFFSPTVFSSQHKRVGGSDPLLRTYQIFRYSEFIKPN
jgi:peptide/nickel transport system substrate-binding protein